MADHDWFFSLEVWCETDNLHVYNSWLTYGILIDFYMFKTLQSLLYSHLKYVMF